MTTTKPMPDEVELLGKLVIEARDLDALHKLAQEGGNGFKSLNTAVHAYNAFEALGRAYAEQHETLRAHIAALTQRIEDAKCLTAETIRLNALVQRDKDKKIAELNEQIECMTRHQAGVDAKLAELESSETKATLPYEVEKTIDKFYEELKDAFKSVWELEAENKRMREAIQYAITEWSHSDKMGVFDCLKQAQEALK